MNNMNFQNNYNYRQMQEVMFAELISQTEQEIQIAEMNLDDEDEDCVDPDQLVEECINCKCCNGYPYDCQNSEMCIQMG